MNQTDLSRLSAKQKRFKSWKSFAEEEVPDEDLKNKTLKVLNLFSDKLYQVWAKGTFSDEDNKQIENYERQLEELNDASRMSVGR